VLGNFEVSALSSSFTFPVAGTWYNLFDNSVITTAGAAQTVTLQPGEYRVYVNRNVNNLTTTPVSNVPWNGTSLAVTAYPNPVQASYTVDVSLPQSGNTTILLYNNMGQYMRTVYSGFLPKGERQLSLQRPPVAKGTYFLKLQVKAETKTIPITLQ
jgi:1,4-alpha-glucan branching enzyme